MILQSTKSCAWRVTAVFCALGFFAASSHAQAPAQAASAPFENLDGAWGGSGTISMKNGANERIRCRVNYMITEGGRLLSQDLRCASDSYKFELQTTVAHQGGALTGTWNETTRSVVGSISGRISGGEINAVATSNAFSANLAISTKGDRQSVSIRSPGSEVSEVSITLRKGAR